MIGGRSKLRLVLAAALAFGLLPAAATADGERILSGTYTSRYQDRPSTVRAVFTPGDSPGEWKVIFNFRYGARDHSYRGVAAGDFTAGPIAGRVDEGTGGRVFVFRLEKKNGRYTGEHGELRRAGEDRTGTMTLRG